MATAVNGLTGAGSSQPADATESRKDLVGKDAFLTLLVAQIRNQNPLNPADGIQFLSQLAQFSQLEQLISINTQLETLTKSGATEPALANGSKDAATNAAA